MDKETKKEFSNLGRMVKKGFDDVDKKFGEVHKELGILKQDTEEIKLRLDQVAYRFELQDLEKRFEKRLQKVELKLGLRKT